MYRQIEGNPDLQPVFRTNIKRVWRALQTPDGFREYLTGITYTYGWSLYTRCAPLEDYTRGLVAKTISVSTYNLRPDSLRLTHRRGNPFPVVEVDVPGWVRAFLAKWYWVWDTYVETIGKGSEPAPVLQFFDDQMQIPAPAVLKLL